MDNKPPTNQQQNPQPPPQNQSPQFETDDLGFQYPIPPQKQTNEQTAPPTSSNQNPPPPLNQNSQNQNHYQTKEEPRTGLFTQHFDDQYFIRNPGKAPMGYEDDGSMRGHVDYNEDYQRQGYGTHGYEAEGEGYEDEDGSYDEVYNYNQRPPHRGQGMMGREQQVNRGLNNRRNLPPQGRANGYGGGYGGGRDGGGYGRGGNGRGYDEFDEEGVDSHYRPAVNDNPGPIVMPNRRGRQFEIRPNYLTILPKFSGNAIEEPYFHLDEYHAICSTIGGPHFTQEEVKLRLFQFSLTGKAKQWYHMLPSNSIHTWHEMQQEFLDEFFPMGKTTDAIENIRLFQQQSGEPLHEAWARFKELIRLVPHHEMKKWELIKAFCDGLMDDEIKYVRSTSGGKFLTRNPDFEWNFLEEMAKDSKTQASARRKSKGQSSRYSRSDVELKERMETLERHVSKMGRTGGREVKSIGYGVCEVCQEIGHNGSDCPSSVPSGEEEINQVYSSNRKPYDMNSNTYHPGLRNHPNFSYANATNQLNPNFQVPNQGAQTQQQQGGYQRQYNQGGQQGGYQRRYNQAQEEPQAQIANNNPPSDMATILSMLRKAEEKQEKRDAEARLKDEIRDKAAEAVNRQIEQMVGDISLLMSERKTGVLPSDTMVNPAHQNSIPKNSINVHINSVSTLPKFEVSNEDFTSPPLVSTGPRRKVDEVEESDPRAPVIPIKVEKFKIKNALLDYGADASILPGMLYDQYEFGPLEDVDTTVVLADLTQKHPRGIIKDVMIKIGDF